MDTFNEPFRAIFAAFTASQRPVQLFVGLTADAAAAARTLMRLLRVFHVTFEAHPVVDYGEVQRVAAELKAQQIAGDAPDTLLLVGCGATVDVSRFIDLTKATVHILDSARPVHLDNVRNDAVILWAAQSVRLEIDAFFREQSKKRRHEGRRARRHRRRDNGDESNESGDSSGGSESDYSDEDSEVDDEDDESGAINWQRAGEVPAEVEALYYSTRWAGAAAAVCALQLAEEINQLERDFVWSAAVGVTDLFMRGASTRADYTFAFNGLRDAVNQINARGHQQQQQQQRGGGTGGTGGALGALDDLTNAAGGGSGGRDAATHFQTTKLATSHEHRLVMLRHTNLWDALWHEPSIAAAYKLHHVDDGEERVRALLARIGVSRREAETPWAQITHDVRARTLHLLQAELEPLVGDFVTQTITRAVGFGTEVSAFDACRFFTAVVTVPPSASAAGGAASSSSSSAGAGAASGAAPGLTKEAIATHRRAQFWMASDALVAGPHSPKFTSIVSTTSALYKSIATAAAALLGQRGAVITTRMLHYVLISADGARATETFWDPLRLRLLANQLMHSLAADKARRAAHMTAAAATAVAMRPVLLSAPHPDGQTFTIVETHPAVRAASVVPVVGCFEAAVADEEFAPSRRDQFVERGAALVFGRDNATHLVESVHLRLATARGALHA